MNIPSSSDPNVLRIVELCNSGDMRNFGKTTMCRLIAAFCATDSVPIPINSREIDSYRIATMNWLEERLAAAKAYLDSQQDIQLPPDSEFPKELLMFVDKDYAVGSNASVPQWAKDARILFASCGMATEGMSPQEMLLFNSSLHSAGNTQRLKEMLAYHASNSNANSRMIANAIACRTPFLGKQSRAGDHYTPSTWNFGHVFKNTQGTITDADGKYEPEYVTIEGRKFSYGFRNKHWFQNATEAMLSEFISMVSSGKLGNYELEHFHQWEFEAAMVCVGITQAGTTVRTAREIYGILSDRWFNNHERPQPNLATTPALTPEAVVVSEEFHAMLGRAFAANGTNAEPFLSPATPSAVFIGDVFEEYIPGVPQSEGAQ